MKAANIRELRYELQTREEKELIELCIKLAKYKKENKELLTYYLFEAEDEDAYILGVKEEMDEQFAQIKSRSYYAIRKSVRKILRLVKKYIRYSKKKETEVQLLFYFCNQLKAMDPPFHKSRVLYNLFARQIVALKKAISYLHEDLQFDYKAEMRDLLS